MNYEPCGDDIINGEDTYDTIAEILLGRSPVFLGWTDERGTHCDIVLNYDIAYTYGTHQGGMGKSQDLYVCLMRWGSFAFSTDSNELYSSYVGEKLNVHGPTADKLTELINNVVKRLKEVV